MFNAICSSKIILSINYTFLVHEQKSIDGLYWHVSKKNLERQQAMYKFSKPQKENNLKLCELCVFFTKYIVWNTKEMHI